jgi:aminoglycoside phosphotransferase (APT) family kinase protein
MEHHEATARRLAEIATGRRALGHEVLAGGFRHMMVRITCDHDRQVVVRLRPAQSTGVAVEAAVLARAAGAVPVPRVLLSDPGGARAGVSALVLSHVTGVRADEVLSRAPVTEVHQIGELLGATAARLRQVRFDRPGLFADATLRTSGTDGSLSRLVMSLVDEGLAAVPDDVLPRSLRGAWRTLVAASAQDVDALGDHATLVHSDFNPKNVLLRRRGGAWDVAALVDWEFAFAGPALVDLGNLQRFAHQRPKGYATAIGRGFSRAGGQLPPHWRRVAATLDAMALAEMLGSAHAAPLRHDIVDVITRAVARATLVSTDE